MSTDFPTQVRAWPQRANYTAMLAPDVPYPAEARQAMESRIIAELARQTHEMGGRWADWPRFTLHDGDHAYWDPRRLDAEVWVIPR